MQTHKFQSIYPDSKATSDHNNKSTLKTFPQPYWRYLKSLISVSEFSVEALYLIFFLKFRYT